MQRHIPLTELGQQSFANSIKIICPKNSDWASFEPTPLKPYSPLILDFFKVLSAELMSLGQTWPDLAALGFFIRQASLTKEIDKRKTSVDGQIISLGMTFHLVPSNVPTVAFYSWLAALLQGNSAVIRLSSQELPLQDAIFKVLDSLFSMTEWQPIAHRTRFIRYPHDEFISACFSSNCDVRVIWGGNETIRDIRAIPLNPSAKEIVFPDRKSVAVIDSDYIHSLFESSQRNIAKLLAQDISRFNQQACASPTSIIWLGERDTTHEKKFWEIVSLQLPDEFADKTEQTINLQLAAADGWVDKIEQRDDLMVGEYQSNRASACLQAGFGTLYIQYCSSLKHWLRDAVNYQTCVYVGEGSAQLKLLLDEHPEHRIDRICHPGQALAFDWYWDGMDMLTTFTRTLR